MALLLRHFNRAAPFRWASHVRQIIRPFTSPIGGEASSDYRAHRAAGCLALLHPVVKPLQPLQWVGLWDAEGCFTSAAKVYSNGVESRRPKASLEMNSKEVSLINAFDESLDWSSSCRRFSVANASVYVRFDTVPSLGVLRDFFSRFMFLTVKHHDFNRWAEMVHLFENGLHRTQQGSVRVRELASQMNTQRPAHFLPGISLQCVADRYTGDTEFAEWFSGFVTGEGCFTLLRGRPTFAIRLHAKDHLVLQYCQRRLEMGSISLGKASESAYAVWQIQAWQEVIRFRDYMDVCPPFGTKCTSFVFWKQYIDVVTEMKSQRTDWAVYLQDMTSPEAARFANLRKWWWNRSVSLQPHWVEAMNKEFLGKHGAEVKILGRNMKGSR
eukprot:GDKI01009578.1.p1 GENE.GDKI01009578.1~~GDKI01009578.1.p1  ORF type:complete len:383 (+),score=13.66 GDKI01009578.1:73-1221(+)